MQIGKDDLLDFLEGFFELILERRPYKETLSLLIETAMKLTDSQMGNIFSYNRKKDRLELMVRKGFTQETSLDCLQIGDGAAGSAARELNTVFIDDYERYVSGLDTLKQKKLEPFARAISSSIGVPLFKDGLLIGSLAISRDKNHQRFDNEQIEIAEFFSKIASLLLNYSYYLYEHQNRIANMKNRIEFFKSKSNIDPLTSVYNRGALESFLNRIFNRGRGIYSIIMADIDWFKRINDRFGHLAGDEVLKQVASVISAHIRKEDKVFRYGGEEFAIILREPVDIAAKIAEKIRVRFEKLSLRYENKEIKYTVSFGVAPILIYSDGISDCIERADRALYAAKNGGRNRVEVNFRK